MTLSVSACCIDIYDCEETEAHWEIVRADGITEVHTVLSIVMEEIEWATL